MGKSIGIVKLENGNIKLVNELGQGAPTLPASAILGITQDRKKIQVRQQNQANEYIVHADVQYTQIEPAAQVAFDPNIQGIDQLMTLLSEFFFFDVVVSEWAEAAYTISANDMATLGTTPIELLPAVENGAYEYTGTILYNHGTADYTFNDNIGVIGADSKQGMFITANNSAYASNRIFFISNSSSPFVDISFYEANFNKGYAANEALVFGTRGGNNPTVTGGLGSVGGTFTINLRYKLIIF
jgi:hypothetical protein